MSDLKWHKELVIFSKIKPLIIIEGNIFDIYNYQDKEGNIHQQPLDGYLHSLFKDLEYDNISFYDRIKGFYNSNDVEYIEKFRNLVGGQKPDDNGYISASFTGTKNDCVSSMVRKALTQYNERTVIVMNFASRYITTPDHIEQSEVDSFTAIMQTTLEDIGENLLVMVVNKVNDIPVWFYHDNPMVKIIRISTPTQKERELFVKGTEEERRSIIDNKTFCRFFSGENISAGIEKYKDKLDELERIQDRFVALTEGFCFSELISLRDLCKNERIGMEDLCDVVELYKYGLKADDNPWKSKDLKEKLKTADEKFKERVKGQENAVAKTLDVVKRAVTGMSGLQHSSYGKPKGILFFAGPTGTGKTETAKTLSEILFGDESSCKRFDMSEYTQSHSDQKLFGAPPGYVGYEAGGQLTNAVKENPFSILLFDEIDKADRSILDKFLQILEDGRMTDGQGNTVYFSECIIIFTSNLGIYTDEDENGVRHENVTRDMKYPEIEKNVRTAIENHFKIKMGRPEILNRIGENIVVFNYISEDVADKILDSQINKIVKNLYVEHKIKVDLSDMARKVLKEKSIGNLDNGARGIGNIVESMFINPLSRYIFDNDIESGTIKILNINSESMPAEIECEVNSI